MILSLISFINKIEKIHKKYYDIKKLIEINQLINIKIDKNIGIILIFKFISKKIIKEYNIYKDN